jgi:hypothetical protein
VKGKEGEREKKIKSKKERTREIEG